MSPRWRVAELEGTAAELHADSAGLVSGNQATASVRVLSSVDRAVVLGSTQPESDIDRPRATDLGLSVARRRSGGGAVLVGPGEALWIDVVVPTGDPLWDADVGRASWWVGQVWVEALAAVGLAGGEVWHGAVVRTAWSDRVCFAGLGGGEVTRGGSKVVGISQRRTRAGALLQCAVPIRWDPAPLVEVLRWRPGEQARATADMAVAAAGIGAERAGPIVAAFLDRLP